MPDYLAVDDWKKQIKAEPKLPAVAPVTKALEAYERVDPDDYEEAVDALDQVVTSARLAKGKNSAKKDIAEYLGDVVAEAEKKLKVAKVEAAKAEEGGEEGAVLKAMLLKARKVDDKRARPFVLALGKPAGLVLAKGPSVGTEHKKRAREMRTGTGKLFLGRCFGLDGKLCFKLDVEPPGGMAKAIKKAVLAHSKLTVRLVVRGPKTVLDDETDIEEIADLGSDDEEVGTGSVETYAERRDAQPSKPKSTEELAFDSRLAGLRTKIDEALKPESGVADEVKLMAGEANALARAGRFEEAVRRLNEVERRIDTGPVTGTASTEQTAYESRLARVRPLLENALKGGGSLPDRLKMLRSQMELDARKGGYAKAAQGLTQIEALLDQPEAKGTCEALLKEFEADHFERLRSHPAEAQKLRTLMEYAAEKAEAASLAIDPTAQNNLYVQAVKALRQYEALAATLGKAPKVLPPETLTRSAVLWESAVRKAKVELAKLAAKMRDEFKGLPEAPEVNTAADEIVGALGDFEGVLVGQLRKAAAETNDGKRSPLVGAALATFRDHRRQLDERPVLAEVDRNPFLPVAVYRTLSLTVKEVGKSLGV